MDWERFGRTRKIGGEQTEVGVQYASMGTPTALIGYGEEEEEEEEHIKYLDNSISRNEATLVLCIRKFFSSGVS